MAVSSANYTNGLTSHSGTLIECLTAMQTAGVPPTQVILAYWDATANKAVFVVHNRA